MGFILPYTFTFRYYRQYSAIAILYTFQFTVTHALGFSVFTSRILATALPQSHCNFKSHVKSSLRSLSPFLPFLQLPFPKTRLASSRLPTWPHSSTIVYSVLLCFYESESESYITTDGQSTSLSWKKAPIWSLWPDLLLSDSCGVLDVVRSLWREDGSVVYICCWPSPA
jgi:hypothetical protein